MKKKDFEIKVDCSPQLVLIPNDPEKIRIAKRAFRRAR